MKSTVSKIGVTCVLTASLFMFSGVGVNAQDAVISTSNAGITAALEQSYYTEKTNFNMTPTAVATPTDTTAAANSGAFGYSNLGVAAVDGHLNVRAAAGEDADVVGKMPADAGCEILSVEGEWTKISSGNVEGYVKSEFLLKGMDAVNHAQQVMTTMATVNTSTLKVRTEPNTDSEVLILIPEGEEIEVIQDVGDWVLVDVNGDQGYVSKEFVNIAGELKKAVTVEELKYGEGVSDVRVALVQYALQFVGNPYVWGGTSLTNGADCSGFVLSIYSKYGVYLPHSSASQAGYGRKINSSEAQPGDLFFYGSGSISHVAIYIGNGQVVHAFSEKAGIKVTSAFYRTPICVTSLL